MSGADALVGIDVRTDHEAPARVARVSPDALLDIVRAAVSVDGAIWIRVTGKSMNPIIRHGDRVLIAASHATPPLGAVVLLDAGGFPVLHRVIGRRAGSVITRGDSRAMSDPPRPLASVLGRAIVVRRGDETICLAPTLAFGIAPLIRAAAWWLRVRLPDSWGRWIHRLRSHER